MININVLKGLQTKKNAKFNVMIKHLTFLWEHIYDLNNTTIEISCIVTA